MSKGTKTQKEAKKENAIPVLRHYNDFCLQCSEEMTGKPYGTLKKEERIKSKWAATYTDLTLTTPVWRCTKCGREYKRVERTQK